MVPVGGGGVLLARFFAVFLAGFFTGFLAAFLAAFFLVAFFLVAILDSRLVLFGKNVLRFTTIT
jgi:hypothetical protein